MDAFIRYTCAIHMIVVVGRTGSAGAANKYVRLSILQLAKQQKGV